jgi:hypothetical protein
VGSTAIGADFGAEESGKTAGPREALEGSDPEAPPTSEDLLLEASSEEPLLEASSEDLLPEPGSVLFSEFFSELEAAGAAEAAESLHSGVCPLAAGGVEAATDDAVVLAVTSARNS